MGGEKLKLMLTQSSCAGAGTELGKRQNEITSSPKNGKYLILGRNSDFREKFGILELEMSHPGYRVMIIHCWGDG